MLRLAAGQYFGERALLTSAKRAANVVAIGRVTLLAIGRAHFEAMFGPLQVGDCLVLAGALARVGVHVACV